MHNNIPNKLSCGGGGGPLVAHGLLKPKSAVYSNKVWKVRQQPVLRDASWKMHSPSVFDKTGKKMTDIISIVSQP